MKLETTTKELNDALERLKCQDEEIQNAKDKIKELETKKAEAVEEKETLKGHFQSEKSQLEKSLFDMKSKLDEISNEISMRNKENKQLKVTLEEVQIHSGSEAERREQLEKLVKKLDQDRKYQESLTKSFQSEAKEKESSNKALLKKFQELKNKYTKEENQHQETLAKVYDLEKEVYINILVDICYWMLAANLRAI